MHAITNASRLAPCLLAALALLAWAGTALGAEFYVDPVNGSAAGTGTAGDPWLTIEQVLSDGLIETQVWDSLPYVAGSSTLIPHNAGAPVKAGDTLWLRTGYHGEVVFNGYYNAAPVTIAAQTGHTPGLSRIATNAGSNWTFRGISISPSHAPSYANNTCVSIRDHNFHGPSHHYVIEDCAIFSVPDVSGWTQADWRNLSANAILIDADDSVVQRNDIRNIYMGISTTGSNISVAHNTVDRFGGDGARVLGDNTTFEYNTIKNSYWCDENGDGIHDGNDNHDDLFQSWTNGPGGVGSGTVTGVVIRGNTMICQDDPAIPFPGTPQGVGCFDGTFVNWRIENNVIVADHWHGITLLGADGCVVINNTVVDPNASTPGPCWISIDDHKSGTAPTNCVVRNNISNSLNNAGSGVTEDSNLTIAFAAYATYFVNAATFDLHILETAPAVDVGSATGAPSIDHDTWPRPYGAGYDVGAFEWQPAPPPGGGGGGNGNSGGGGCAMPARRGGAPFAANALLLLIMLGVFAATRSRMRRCTASPATFA